ncbi:MAG: hypothetical protein HFI93_08430 [Lachnospiraceae bacterium]|nr:hypothetical protein [Lachnospiraceae bacterium]
MKIEWKGSYTVEAALVLPLIFTAFASVLIFGMRQAGDVSAEMMRFKEEWRIEKRINFSERLRVGQAAADWLGDE